MNIKLEHETTLWTVATLIRNDGLICRVKSMTNSGATQWTYQCNTNNISAVELPDCTEAE